MFGDCDNEGHRYEGTGQCLDCGWRLRCGFCGQYLRDDDVRHYETCKGLKDLREDQHQEVCLYG
jgi:hypothetical protein